MEKPQHKPWMALPSVAKGQFIFRLLPKFLENKFAPKLFQIYPRTKKYCIVFLLPDNLDLFIFPTRGVCRISPGFLVLTKLRSSYTWSTTICSSLPTSYGDQYLAETQDMDALTWTNYCCGWPMVKLVATIWAIATCVILFLIYFIRSSFYHRRVMFGSTLPSVES